MKSALSLSSGILDRVPFSSSTHTGQLFMTNEAGSRSFCFSSLVSMGLVSWMYGRGMIFSILDGCDNERASKIWPAKMMVPTKVARIMVNC